MLVFDSLVKDGERVRERAELLRRRMAAGVPLGDIVGEEERPLIVETVRDALSRVVEAFAVLQRTEANQLHREGMSMERIGQLFGISRQRVAQLIERSN